MPNLAPIISYKKESNLAVDNGASDGLEEILNVMELDMFTIMGECQAYLYYRFWAGVLFFAGF